MGFAVVKVVQSSSLLDRSLPSSVHHCQGAEVAFPAIQVVQSSTLLNRSSPLSVHHC
jgi:hypothetical protein